MAALRRHDVAHTIAGWARAVRDSEDIRKEVKEPGGLNKLAVSDCDFDNSGSNITHTEYLHLRTIWYRYTSKGHIEDFAKLFRNNDKTGYKGFVSPESDERAQNLVARMSPYLKKYLEECRKPPSDADSLHPSPDCGYFAMVRYWQVLVTTHTKDIARVKPNIIKRQVKEETRGRPTTPAGQQQPSGGPSSVATPPRQAKSGSRSPPKFETPAATSHLPARGSAENRPSADETYVNFALLLLLQAVAQEFHKDLSELTWVPPRMALHLEVPVWNRARQVFEEKRLLEAQVDGYLCDADGTGLYRPLAICEAKSAVRLSVQIPTERQEAAEMAAWICHRPSNEGLLQSSATVRVQKSGSTPRFTPKLTKFTA